MYKRSMAVFLVLAILIIGGSLYGYYEKDKVITLDAVAKEDLPAAEITVYVSGAVNKPGVVTLPEKARVVDAVNLCGGVLASADAGKINMAQALKDGMQVVVPEKLAGNSSGNEGQSKAATPAGSSSNLININTADAKELDRLPGVGPAMAQRIIEYRITSGAFQAIEDLKKVHGMGATKFEKLKDKVSL
ncbi:competence protein ComEA [Propionispira arboris]|uniref:Competence protein ComEA n=2 Tax=Propionispira arboris TaxID=84035 RepID=A0A1H7CQJ0_9FIRM|nr:competence protein ComEA [Propionispira arboris]